MHGRPALRHETADHSRRGFILEELTRNLANRLVGSALAHADEDDAFANRHDISTFHGGILEILIGVAPPDLDLSTLESRMKLVDGSLQQRLGPDGPARTWDCKLRRYRSSTTDLAETGCWESEATQSRSRQMHR